MTPRAAPVRFYVDADIIGFGKVIAALRPDVTFPGDPGAEIHKRKRPPCPVTRTDLPDLEWIPEVARHGWLIITRDSMISNNPLERAAVREHSAKMVALSGKDASNKWGQLEVFMSRWRDIEALVDQPGPFIWRASRTTMTQIPLD
jgi:hypothetical protein